MGWVLKIHQHFFPPPPERGADNDVCPPDGGKTAFFAHKINPKPLKNPLNGLNDGHNYPQLISNDSNNFA